MQLLYCAYNYNGRDLQVLQLFNNIYDARPTVNCCELQTHADYEIL